MWWHTHTINGGWLLSRLGQVYKTFSDNPKWAAPLINMTFHLLKPLKHCGTHVCSVSNFFVSVLCPCCVYICTVHTYIHEHLQAHHFLMRCCTELGVVCLSVIVTSIPAPWGELHCILSVSLIARNIKDSLSLWISMFKHFPTKANRT